MPLYISNKDLSDSERCKSPCYSFIIGISDNQKIYNIRFFLDGKLHRTDGPAVITWDTRCPDNVYEGQHYLYGQHYTPDTFKLYAKMELDRIPLEINSTYLYKAILLAKLGRDRTTISYDCDEGLKNTLTEMTKRNSYF